MPPDRPNAMSDTLLAISRSLSADVQTLATISHNVANINTPGYRGTRAIPEFGEQLRVRTALDQGDGGLKQTDRPLDLELRGPGFVVVERDGVPPRPRAGDFRVDRDGLAATSGSARVLRTSRP